MNGYILIIYTITNKRGKHKKEQQTFILEPDDAWWNENGPESAGVNNSIN